MSFLNVESRACTVARACTARGELSPSLDVRCLWLPRTYVMHQGNQMQVWVQDTIPHMMLFNISCPCSRLAQLNSNLRRLLSQPHISHHMSLVKPGLACVECEPLVTVLSGRAGSPVTLVSPLLCVTTQQWRPGCTNGPWPGYRRCPGSLLSQPVVS